ncbi:MAG: alpha/beta hydrolase [Propionibacteriaceae bacterium]|jgi:hypothetical protein|nr:alpha/beta hydrolase [Propionibacteriaceae bacterium]
MAINWDEIQRWDPKNLNSASRKLRELRQGLMTEVDDANGAKNRIKSTGAAVEAMKTSLGSLNSNLDQLVNDISELMMATAAAAEGVWDVKTKVLECTSFVAENTYLKIQGNGEVVVDLSGKYAGGSMEAKNKGKDLENLIKAALDRARDVDDAYDKRLKAVGDGTYKSSETASSQSQGLPDLPQKGWSATEVAAWWNALTPEEKKNIIENHPDDIRNLDGISANARDEANRKVLDKELERARHDRDELQKKVDEEGFDDDNINPYLDDKNKADKRVKDLEKIQNLMGEKEGDGSKYHLLTLDASGDKDVRAAIAMGDVDKASNIATVVPGVGTTVRDSMDGELHKAEELRNHSGSDNTAAVAWIGYDTPDSIWSPETRGTGTADEGARSLNGFHEGIHAYRQSQGSDPHITTVAHSYGSLTAGTAALTTKAGAVDDMVLYGSPGGRATDVHQYNVPEGHVYASANDKDEVTGKGGWWQGILGGGEEAVGMGKKPVELHGVKNIASNGGGHDDYWNNPEFVEDASQIVANEDPGVDRSDNQAEAVTKPPAKK